MLLPLFCWDPLFWRQISPGVFLPNIGMRAGGRCQLGAPGGMFQPRYICSGDRRYTSAELAMSVLCRVSHSAYEY